jgi:hypothetical protein
MECRNMKVYAQYIETHKKDRLNKHFNVKRSCDTREWERIDKGMKRNENKHETRKTEGVAKCSAAGALSIPHSAPVTPLSPATTHRALYGKKGRLP